MRRTPTVLAVFARIASTPSYTTWGTVGGAGGGAAFTAAATSSMGAPHPRVRAEPTNEVRNSAGVKVGSRASTMAAAPATTGVAIDVPDL